jgi:biopolymer transport protein TolR
LEIGAFARKQAEKASEQPIMIAGDRDIKYGTVMDVMSTLKENGVKKISLAVKTQ